MQSQQGVSAVLAGRGDELAFLNRALREAPGALLVGGEAGVGKSRLIKEFLDANPEVRTLCGGCLQISAEGLPFAPFSAMLRRLVREIGVDGVAALLPGGTPAGLARLLPEFGRPDTETGTAEARIRLFDHVLLLFERLTEREPAVLVIEDVHWAERSTRDLLSYLIRNLPAGLLVIATYRSDELHRDHPLRPLLAELGRVDWVRRLDLDRLPRRAVAEQARGILGRDLDQPSLDAVYGRSEGNPLFVEALLSCDGQINGELPESLRDLILGSVRKLPEETQEVLRVASAGGDRVEHALLAAVTGLDDGALSRVLRPAVAANVLVVDGEAYGFRHALMREAVHGDLLPGEHTRTHTRFAEALEGDPSLVPMGRAAAELAHHWYSAHDATWALVSAWKAAQVAKEATAYTECLRMLDRVLELWEKVPDAAERLGVDHVTVLERAIDASDLAGETERGVAFAKAALKEIDDPIRAAGVLEHRGRLKIRLGHPKTLDDLREAARLVPADPPSVARARVLSTLAQQLYLLPTGAVEARALAVAALETARTVGDATVEAHALTTIAGIDFSDSDGDRHLAELAKAEALYTRGGVDDSAMLRIATNESHVLEGMGEHERAVEVARRGVALAGKHGLARTSGAFLSINLAEPLLSLGRWDEALEVVEHALELSPPPLTRASLHYIIGVIAVARGDLDTASRAAATQDAVLAPTFSRTQELFPSARLRIDLRVAQGDLDGALDAVEFVLVELQPAVSARYGLPLMCAAARACAEAGGERAAGLLTRIRASAEKTPDGGCVQRAYALRFEAEAARAEGVLDRAAWAAVATAFETLKEPYPLAYALLRTAEASDPHDGGTREDTAARLRKAAEIAEDLGARPLRERIEAHARRSRIALGGRTDGPVLGLTPRELEVLRLVAEGCGNREIAGRLFISAKTASVHVSNILAKLQVASRGEAAAAAHRLGIV
ncbi:helix-turn-helix transcriptional regulator [Actinoallomurus soli]|uniref:helix-turn-helix transcriptional regulator n=1 Tax=Actinoallomurus soli TaxID=2952535 RepID=UPI002093FD7B|nr:AAA family ATPase [Actinoallomurus soli]MCO5968566.1 AAA family ATPase [Actinoallomurus soli]